MEPNVLAAQLEQLYAIDYLVNPKISVTPRARIIGTANLKGLINRQGPLPMTAVVSLADILAQAGGVMGPRNELDAIILRSVDIAVKARRIPLAAISLTQSPGPTILPGDQITILKREKLPVIKDESGYNVIAGYSRSGTPEILLMLRPDYAAPTLVNTTRANIVMT